MFANGLAKKRSRLITLQIWYYTLLAMLFSRCCGALILKMMIWKNKTNKVAIKTIDMTGKDGNGLMIRFIPCIDTWLDDGLVIGISWLAWGIEFWFTDVSDLD
jgi:hypothetical protein